ncbi:MAG: hypothetical protein PHG67_08470 [Bacteroidales bacterium]|jgi:hypothetical protein|nr:hypothetical protein [Bacteroidales bacterium]HOI33399.1 hypothetical protein [Bacteroidales bacterium]
MKRNDWFVIMVGLLVIAAFLWIPELDSVYANLNHKHGLWMSFAKFAVLATFGECLALRIRTGKYNRKGFGILPRAIVWGFLGITIKMAFVIYTAGTPQLLLYLGWPESITALAQPFSLTALLTAFSISVAMNLTYAPVMMTIHKITDTHILENGGTIRGFFKPIALQRIFTNLDWKTQWNFVFRKTIPFFWIPAHTITFLLPVDYQVLFAAGLGIALGLILSLAAQK